jgi:NADH-quinone oxidoreductase subunit C
MFDDPLNNLMHTIQQEVGDACLQAFIQLGEMTMIVKRESIVHVLTCLRDHRAFLFTQLVDICGVDYPERPLRFEIVYHLLSHKKNHRLRVKTHTDEQTPVPTVCGVYSSAGWYEREVWDLYGVTFDGHPDLRRILTDYGFEGHPLRKDFPLTGYVEVHYDTQQKRVAYRPVQLPQDYRNFDFLSPWEGMTPQGPMLPGDEKADRDQT